jgi:uncharacterized protein YdeI (BOF family)
MQCVPREGNVRVLWRFLAFASLIVAAGTLWLQPALAHGPFGITARTVTVAQLLSAPLAYRFVAVRGRVGVRVGNAFLLEDGTGRVRVDAGPSWYHTVPVQEGETVTVAGEVDTGPPWAVGRTVGLDAYWIQREDGSVVTIRTRPGPPPWAGGPRGGP